MRRFASEALLPLTVELEDATVPLAMTVRLGGLDVTDALPATVREALEDEAAARVLEDRD